MGVDFTILHTNCDGGKCLLCTLESGICPWCDAVDNCEHRVSDDDHESLTRHYVIDETR